jgi:hypothetical protein
LNFPRNPCFGFALLPAIAAALPLHALLSLSRDLDLLPADLDSRILYFCFRAVRSVFVLQNATGVVNSFERTQTSSSFGFLFFFRLLEDVCANVLFWFFTVKLRAAVEVRETGGRENL